MGNCSNNIKIAKRIFFTKNLFQKKLFSFIFTATLTESFKIIVTSLLEEFT